jgi:hypothetical protein
MLCDLYHSAKSDALRWSNHGREWPTIKQRDHVMNNQLTELAAGELEARNGW